MKGKFKLLGHIGLVLFVMSALMLTLAPVAQAATAVTNVWVEFDYTDNRNTISDSGNQYIIHFKAATALVRGVDTITVTFPDGATAMGPAAFSAITSAITAGDIDFSTNYDTGDLVTGATWTDVCDIITYGGRRVKVVTPIDVSALQDVWVKFATTSITSAATASSDYKVYVSTSKDQTPVLSDPFELGHDTNAVSSVSTTVAPATAGAVTQYIITFTAYTALTASTGDVAVKFPKGTVLPSSITAANVYFKEANDTDYTACGVAPTVYANRRIVIATTPITLDASQAHSIKFVSAAGITNPTVAETTNHKCMVRTSGDREWVLGSDHDISAGAGTKVAIANGETGRASSLYSDNATMINMYGSQIYVYLADQYGNGVTPASATTVTPSSSSTGGGFYTAANVSGTGSLTAASTIEVDITDGYDPNQISQILYYRDTTAGTHTLTFAASGYTSATWTFKVAPGVSVYDSGNNLINTYAAITSSPASETSASYAGSAAKYASDYVNDAITGAMAGDTVKLGDGIYEVDADSSISLSKKITLTSVNGASSTTIRNTNNVGHNTGQSLNGAIQVTTDGTATNPIIIDGLTFQRLRTDLDICTAIINAGNDYVTVRNCVFNNIEPDTNSSFEGVIWFRSDDTITSWTISNNTFNSCVTTWPDMGGGPKSGCIIVAGSNTTKQISGVTISGNTLTNCSQYGITLGGNSTKTASGTISNNTITSGYSSIDLCDYLGTVSLTGNTITGAYNYGVYLEGDNNTSVTIKNNTITGCAGTHAIFIEGEATTVGIVTVQYNDIYNNASDCYAIEACAVVVSSVNYGQDCKYNYFGSATGPAYTALTGATVTKSNPNGTGGAITDYVTYYPWLYKSRADVVADNASYQASTMKLVSGWNTLSTPVKLIDTADAISELITSGMTIGYYYDATGWHQITGTYVLNPCDAVYVKMSAVTYVLLKFDAGAFSAPSKALNAGWNLIGLASLSSSGQTDLATVASVAKTAAGLPGYSQLISPSLNATQTNMFGVAGTSWAYAYGQTGGTYSCYAGLGYWVYMQNAATLAGFEITPIAPDLD